MDSGSVGPVVHNGHADTRERSYQRHLFAPILPLWPVRHEQLLVVLAAIPLRGQYQLANEGCEPTELSSIPAQPVLPGSLQRSVR